MTAAVSKGDCTVCLGRQVKLSTKKEKEGLQIRFSSGSPVWFLQATARASSGLAGHKGSTGFCADDDDSGIHLSRCDRW